MALAAALLCLLQEPTVNPRYEHWASFKVGSWAKSKMLMKMQQMEIETETVTTLMEVTDEKVVVETTTKTKMQGREMALPPRKEEITKKPDPAKPMKPVGESEEEVEVAGKKLKCRVYDWEMDAGGSKAKGKVWTTKEIPGGVAKGEFVSERMPDPMKMQTVAWEKK